MRHRVAFIFVLLFANTSMAMSPLDLGWGVRHLTVFWSVGLGCVIYLGIGCPLYCYWYGFPRHWLWSAITLASTLGCWVLYYLLSMLYMLGASEMPVVANLLLPVVILLCEVAFVANLQLWYERLVI